MNRNCLKIIATITMLIDHFGLFLCKNNIIFRIIGRLSFPIFAFFIAEGIRFTRNRKKYTLNLLIFALIAQIPYAFLFKWYKLNILFTFILAIFIILLVEGLIKEIKEVDTFNLIVISLISIFIVILLCFALSFNLIDYGLIGILLILAFYFIKSKLRYMIGGLLLVIMTLINLLKYGFFMSNITQIFSLIAIILLYLYNGQKGKLNLKYFFYVFYPAHLILIKILMLLI